MTPTEIRPERDAAIRAMLVEHVRAEPSVRARRRRNRVIGWGGLGVLTIGIAATAGTMLLGPEPVTQRDYVHCLSEAKRTADGDYPGSGATMAQEPGGLPPDPIELCTLMWEQGLFEPDFDPMSQSNPPGRVPDELQLCVMSDGAAAVVPSSNESICAALGLAEPANQGGGD
ncbi:hypothetical protein LQ757_04865 [Agromyces sp. SYSU K20354]|uniref:hypothetical protein n=1 Tax=Agromyces cavernae TaxID=2898659 RepID=UPI001E377D72|nr:hypothetical protein [Agromyces cavernae]MCD2441603.1 hypothetical protein [Agromyces cavernae]